MVAKEEGGARAPSEYKVGSRVLIFQHHCSRGKLGSYGIVTVMQGTVPLNAECEDCGHTVGVDVKAMQAQYLPRKPKK